MPPGERMKMWEPFSGRRLSRASDIADEDIASRTSAAFSGGVL